MEMNVRKIKRNYFNFGMTCVFEIIIFTNYNILFFEYIDKIIFKTISDKNK